MSDGGQFWILDGGVADGSGIAILAMKLHGQAARTTSNGDTAFWIWGFEFELLNSRSRFQRLHIAWRHLFAVLPEHVPGSLGRTALQGLIVHTYRGV